jgi:DnaK suppressor protein
VTTDVAAQLREKLAAIDAELSLLTAPPEDAGAIQFGKRAGDATNVAAEQLSRVATHEQLLGLRAEVERALEKIDAGTYGVCDGCGEPIADARLEALPWAALCVRCRARSGT